MAQVSRFSLGTRSASSGSASPVSQKNPDRIPIIKTLHEPDGGGGQREDELAEARQAMGGDDPAPPTPTFEPVRRPSPAYGLPRSNLVTGGCRQGGRERARVSEQTRTARCAQRGRPGLPPGTPCSSRPRPCTWSTAAAAARAPCRTPRCRTRARRRGPRARRLRQTVCSLGKRLPHIMMLGCKARDTPSLFP